MAEHTTLESLIAGNIGDTYTDGNVKYTLGQNKVFKERALPKSNELTEHEQNNSAHVKGITNFLAAQGWATSNPGEISSAGGKELQYSGGTFTRVINEIEESFTIAPINPITFKPIFKDGTSAGPDLIELDNTRYEPAEDGVLADVGPEGTDTNDGTAQLLFLDPATGTFYAQYGTQRYASTAAGSYQWHQYERPSPAMSGNIWLAAIILDEDAENFTTAALARIMPVRSSGGGGVPPLLSGATDAQDGGPGLVPAPLIGDEAKFLRGNGAWDNITTDDLPFDSVSGLEVLGPSTLNNAILNLNTDDDITAVGDVVAWETFVSLSGDITLSANSERITLPQSDTPYVCSGYIGADYDGTTAQSIVMELQDVATGAVSTILSQRSQMRNFNGGVDYINNGMYAVFDASDGPVTIELKCVEGDGSTTSGQDIGITGATLFIQQVPNQTVVSGAVTKHRAKIRRNVAGNQTTGPIDFDTVDYDTASMADLAANNITIQRDGFYRVEAMFHVTAGSANRQLSIFNNAVRIGFDIASGPSQGDSVHAVFEGDLSEDDVITASHFAATSNQFIGGVIGPFLSVRELD